MEGCQCRSLAFLAMLKSLAITIHDHTCLLVCPPKWGDPAWWYAAEISTWTTVSCLIGHMYVYVHWYLALVGECMLWWLLGNFFLCLKYLCNELEFSRVYHPACCMYNHVCHILYQMHVAVNLYLHAILVNIHEQDACGPDTHVKPCGECHSSKEHQS